MSVLVSLKIELDATATLSQLESQIEEAGRAAMKEALKQAIRAAEEQQKRCAPCGSEQCQTQGTKRRNLLTRFGRVEVPLKRQRCQACRQVFRPAERCLAEVKGHNVTPELRDLAALVGRSWPYETAAGVLKRLSGVQLWDERLRQITNEQGTAVANEQREQAEQVLQEACVWSRSAHSERKPVPQRNKANQHGCRWDWMEAGCPHESKQAARISKIGVVASQVAAVGKRGRHRLSQRRYVATFGPAEEVGMLTYAAACDLDATEAQQQVVLGDGAQWIKTQAQEHVPDAVQPGKRPARRAWRKEQYEVLLPLLWAGERVHALLHVHHVRPITGEVPPPLEEAIR